MEYNLNKPFYGVQEGILYGQNERVDELNERIQSRYFSDAPLSTNFDPRPVQTKFTLFPIIDSRKESSERILPSINHMVESNFSPATRNGPPSGYFANIDTETLLRNQTVALQHGADRGVYIPSSNSDLYKVHVISRPSEQPFTNLFKKEEYSTYNSNNFENTPIGKDKFFNHTRTQLRNL